MHLDCHVYVHKSIMGFKSPIYSLPLKIYQSPTQDHWYRHMGSNFPSFSPVTSVVIDIYIFIYVLLNMAIIVVEGSIFFIKCSEAVISFLEAATCSSVIICIIP